MNETHTNLYIIQLYNATAFSFVFLDAIFNTYFVQKTFIIQ